MFLAIGSALAVAVLVGSVTAFARKRAACLSEAQRCVVTRRVATQLEDEPARPENAVLQPAIPMAGNDELGPLAKLPPFGPVVVRLLHLCDNPEVEVEEVARLVESDAVLASQLLTLANSPLFGMRGVVSTPGHAVIMLGIDRTRALVTSLVVRFMAQSVSDRNVVRRVWRHSVATAVLARRLAPVFQAEENLAHTAAMLHDLGRLGLLAAHRGNYVQLANKSYETTQDIVTAEENQFGMSHYKAGRLLAKAWGFPETLQAAIAHRHDESGCRDLPSLVQVSCELADSLTYESIHRWDVGTLAGVIETRVAPECREPALAIMEKIENTVIAHVEELDF